MIGVLIVWIVSMVFSVLFFRWFIKEQRKTVPADVVLAVFMCILGPFGALTSAGLYLVVRLEKVLVRREG